MLCLYSTIFATHQSGAKWKSILNRNVLMSCEPKFMSHDEGQQEVNSLLNKDV